MSPAGPDTNPVPPRGDRRRQRTRSAILNAGQRLFAERAMDSVSIDDIVTAADVAKGSFYNHFDDKEGLAHAIVEAVQGDCEAEIFAANTRVHDAPQRMARALCVVIRYARAHPERVQALISLSERRTVATTPLNAGLASDIAGGLASGRFSGVTLDVGVLVAIGIIRTAVAHSMTEASDDDLAPLCATVGAALLRALGTDPGEAPMLACGAATAFFNQDASA